MWEQLRDVEKGGSLVTVAFGMQFAFMTSAKSTFISLLKFSLFRCYCYCFLPFCSGCLFAFLSLRFLFFLYVLFFEVFNVFFFFFFETDRNVRKVKEILRRKQKAAKNEI